MVNSMKIYVISHSEDDIKNIKSNNIYTPLFVGRNGKDNLGYCSDDSGDNISNKNPTYCELTGLYWMWRNDNADIIGLTHYRRFFSKSKWSKRLEKGDFENILKDYDIILPKKECVLLDTVYTDYDHWHYAKDLDVCRNIIEELFPEYLNSFKKVICDGDSLHYYNMFVAPKELMDNYCEWIFTILFEFEQRVDMSNYSNYQKRIYGFLSERLFNVWIDKQNLNIKECDVATKGLRINIHMLIFKSWIVRKPYLFYLHYINKDAKRRY